MGPNPHLLCLLGLVAGSAGSGSGLWAGENAGKAWDLAHADEAPAMGAMLSLGDGRQPPFVAFDGGVYDGRTGLSWLDRDLDGTTMQVAGQAMCSIQQAAGGGWRLPTVQELRTLLAGVDDGCGGGDLEACAPKPRLAGPGPQGCFVQPAGLAGPCGWYWTASVVDGAPRYVDFAAGYAGRGRLSTMTSGELRCVRGTLGKLAPPPAPIAAAPAPPAVAPTPALRPPPAARPVEAPAAGPVASAPSAASGSRCAMVPSEAVDLSRFADGRVPSSKWVSPDGRRVMSTFRVGDQRVVVTDGRVDETWQAVAWETWSDDSARAAYVAERDDALFVVIDGAASPLPARPPRGIALAPSPSARWAVSMPAWKGAAGTVVLDGAVGPDFLDVGVAAFSADGRRFVHTARDAAGWFAHEPGKPDARQRHEALALLRFDARGKVWQVVQDGGATRVVADGKPGPAFAEIRDLTLVGDHFAYAARRADAAVPWVVVSDRGQHGPYDDVGAPVFSADGRRLAFRAAVITGSDVEQRAMDGLDTGTDVLVVDGVASAPWQRVGDRPTFSPDGKSVAVAVQRLDGFDPVWAVLVDGLVGRNHAFVVSVAVGPNGAVAYVAEDWDAEQTTNPDESVTTTGITRAALYLRGEPAPVAQGGLLSPAFDADGVLTVRIHEYSPSWRLGMLRCKAPGGK